MAQSLVKLTLESNQYEANLRQAKKSWEDFTKGLGISVSKFTAVTAAIGAVTGALKVAKDAFFKNEQQLDEWGRTVESASALYDGFLVSLNNGDISGYLSRIGEISQAARDAYDALDALGTHNAFNQLNVQRTRTKYTEDYAGYRTGEASKQQVQASAKAYQDELRQRQKLENEAYRKAIASAAAKMGVPKGNLEQILSEYTSAQFEELKRTPMTGRKTVYSSPTPYSQTSYEVATPANDVEKMAEALRQLNDTELQSLQAMGTQAQKTGEEIANIDKQLARVMNAKEKTATGTKTGSSAKKTKIELTEQQVNQKKINDLELEYVKLGDDATESARERQAEIQREIELLAERNGLLEKRAEQAHGRLTLGAGDFQRDGLRVGGSLFGEPDSSKPKMLDDKAMKAVTKNIETSLKSTSLADIGNEVADSWGGAAHAIGQAGNALSAIKDPELNAAATVAKAVASVALGFAQAAASPATTAGGVWGWIAAAIGGLATMISTIETIHSSTGYAQGGLVRAANGYAVPGNYMSTDKVPILANSGELILNRAQQGNIAAQLTGSSSGSAVGGTPYVSGEQIYLGLSNYMKRTGRGEIVTSR